MERSIIPASEGRAHRVPKGSAVSHYDTERGTAADFLPITLKPSANGCHPCTPGY